jgi:hypothetical protein
MQVYCRIEGPRTSEDVLAPRERPLLPKLEAFLDVLVYMMMDAWGGKDRAGCTQRVLAAAKQVGGSSLSRDM